MTTNLVLANSLVKPRLPKKATVKYRGALLGSIILGIVSLSIVDSSRDFVGYDNYFYDLRVYGMSIVEFHRFEPLFAAVSLPLVQLLSNNLLVYTTLLMVVFYLKLRALSQLCSSGLVFFSLYILYMARFAPLHELTQIRIALALAIWIYALTQTHQRRFWLLLVVFPLAHYSTLTLIPFTLAWYLLRQCRNIYLKVEVFYWFVAVSILIGTVPIISALVDQSVNIFTTVNNQQISGINNKKVNLYAIPILFDLGFLGLFSMAGLVMRTTPEQRFWLWMQFVGIVIFYISSDFPVFAFRLHEIFSLSWVFYLVATIQNRSYIGKLSLMFWVLCIPMYVYIYLVRMDMFHLSFSWMMS
jgi:hypothetical protein